MLGSLGAPELAIIAVVLIVLFGVGKLSGLGKGLGESIREFRSAVKDDKDDDKSASAQNTTQTLPPPSQPQQPPQQQSDPNKNNIF